jgi:hypothetical protein
MSSINILVGQLRRFLYSFVSIVTKSKQEIAKIQKEGKKKKLHILAF